MAESNQQRLRDITDRIESGIRSLFESDQYRSYLTTMSRFHRYSSNNTLLIHLQNPDATLVAGYNAWQSKFGRHVKKGEKGIQIIAPVPVRKNVKNVREDVLDPDTGLPSLDTENEARKEDRVVIPTFRAVTVFDVSQTEGKPLPVLASPLTGDVAHYEAFVEALRRTSPVPIAFEHLTPPLDGYFSPDSQRIAIREGMSQVQTVSAVIHEISHSKLHDYDKLRNEALASGGKPPVIKDRRTEEVEAESISYAVCQYYGIETAENSFGYIAAWSKDKELKELKASLETIRRTASVLIDEIDQNLEEIRRERDLDQEKEVEVPEHEEPELMESASVPVKGAEKATPLSQPDVAFVFARAFCNYEAWLHLTHRLPEPYAIADLEDNIRAYAEHLQHSGPSNARHMLEQFETDSGFPTPDALFRLLEPVVSAWDQSLTCKIVPNELEEHRSFLFASPSEPSENEPSRDPLFYGPTFVCEKMAADLAAGRISTEQIRELNRLWAENDYIPPLGAAEQLYALDDGRLLSLIRSEECYDYTLFDSGTVAEQGTIQRSDVLLIPCYDEISGAFTVLCDRLKLDPDAATLTTREALRARLLPALDTYPMPDQLTQYDLFAAGCCDPELLPISLDRARELYADGFSVFEITEFGAPAICIEDEDLENAKGRVFAIDRAEWEKSPAFRAAVREQRIDAQAEREMAFQNYPGDCFAIYQVRHGDRETRERLFRSLDPLRADGLEPTRTYYDLIFTGALADHPSVYDPEAAYRVFNLNRPRDFGGHSLSVSDIVAFKQSGVVTYHYCDTVGFVELPDFQKPENYLKNAEMAIEDDYGMIDGIINNGPKETGPTQEPSQKEADKPPSLLARLHDKQKEVKQRQTEKAIVQRSVEEAKFEYND